MMKFAMYRVPAAALFGASLLVLAGCDGQQKEMLTAINGQILELRGKLETLTSVSADANRRLQAAEAERKTLEVAIGTIAIRVAGAEAASETALKTSGELAGRFGTLETRLATVNIAGARTDNASRSVSELSARLQALETRSGPGESAERSLETLRRELAAHEARLKTVENRPIAAPPNPANERALIARLAEAKSRLKAVENRPVAAPPIPTTNAP